MIDCAVPNESYFPHRQRLQVHNWATYVLYFGYMLMGCTAVSIMAGTSGFLACLWFVRFIYGAIKAD